MLFAAILTNGPHTHVCPYFLRIVELFRLFFCYDDISSTVNMDPGFCAWCIASANGAGIVPVGVCTIHIVAKLWIKGYIYHDQILSRLLLFGYVLLSVEDD